VPRVAAAAAPNRDVMGGLSVSYQLESRHFFKARDTVRNRDGRSGEVVDGWALYARIRWEDGQEQEVDQFDPHIVVVDRGGSD
jgi:hypothetical protein